MRTSIDARANLDLIEENYRRWQKNPESVDSGWSAFFEGFELGNLPQRNGAAKASRGRPRSRESQLADPRRWSGLRLSHARAYHCACRSARREAPGKSAAQLARARLQRIGSRSAGLSKFFLNNRAMTLREMIAALEKIYADSIGAGVHAHSKPANSRMGPHRLETRPDKHSTPRAVQMAFLRTLLEAESFETFLHTRYVGQKRFSLQGAESLMVILDTILHRCPEGGVEEICMGMAHRGRLNVLANFLRKSLKVIFTEFTENYVPDLVAGDGDVKYHLGYRTVRKLAPGAKSRSDFRPIRAIWKLSIRWSKEKRAPGNGFAATRSIGAKFCRC